ncbi:MAG TPA: hypothetical protein VII41_16675, partial [Steroidobacteraceae bacterium]
MKPQPQDWSQLAVSHAARLPRGTQPPATHTPMHPLLPALALLALALWLCGLAARYGGHELHAALLGAGLVLAPLLAINLHWR